MSNQSLVAFSDISKQYPNGVQALQGLSFAIESGSIHAICGENGAGKSTLMKILFGLESPSSGAIAIDGRPTAIASPRIAAAMGIGMVHQHFALVPSMTVAENVFLGQELRRGGLIDASAARERVRQLAQRYKIEVDPDARVATLSVAAQQKVEILKALSRDVRLLILDEPTAVLSPPETEELFRRLLELQKTGLTVLFISHKLREVRAIANHVTVLRGGRIVGDGPLSGMSDDAISSLIMGREARRLPRRVRRMSGETLLALEDVSVGVEGAGDRLVDVSLAIARGQIIGIAGVDGSGQASLVSVVAGHREPDRGQARFKGAPIAGTGTAALRRQGFAHLPADRQTDGGVGKMSLITNATAGTLRHPDISFGPFLRYNAMRRRTEEMIARYKVRAPGPDSPLSTLSGGNAQKLIAAREFATNPDLLIADQPTRGIDSGAAAFIHERLVELAENGAGILLVTADLDELLSLADRVLVMFGGRVIADLENGPEITSERLGPYMLGLEAA